MKSLRSLLARASLVALLVAPTLAAPKVIATIPVGAFPFGIAVNPRTNTVYVANYLGGSVSVIDGASNAVTATLPIDHPILLMALAARNQIVVYTAFQGIAIIDGSTNKVSGPRLFPVGDAVAQLDKTSLAYVADQNNNQVHVENLSTKQDVVDVPVTSPNSIAVNALANLAYTCSQVSFSPDIAVIDTNSNTVVNTFIPPFQTTTWVSVDPGNNLLYAVVGGPPNTSFSVAMLDATTGNLLGSASSAATTPLSAVLALPDKQAVADGGTPDQQGQNNQLFFINANTFKVTSHLVVGKNPFAMAYNPATKSIYVANTADNTVSVVGQ